MRFLISPWSLVFTIGWSSSCPSSNLAFSPGGDVRHQAGLGFCRVAELAVLLGHVLPGGCFLLLVHRVALEAVALARKARARRFRRRRSRSLQNPRRTSRTAAIRSGEVGSLLASSLIPLRFSSYSLLQVGIGRSGGRPRQFWCAGWCMQVPSALLKPFAARSHRCAPACAGRGKSGFSPRRPSANACRRGRGRARAGAASRWHRRRRPRACCPAPPPEGIGRDAFGPDLDQAVFADRLRAQAGAILDPLAAHRFGHDASQVRSPGSEQRDEDLVQVAAPEPVEVAPIRFAGRHAGAPQVARHDAGMEDRLLAGAAAHLRHAH